MRRYETIFIMRPDLGDSAQKDTIKRFEGLVASAGGDLIETEEWGFRELAYRIKGEQRGFYIRLDYGGNGATMNEIERNLKLSDSILRYLSVLVHDEVDPEVVRAEIAAQRQRNAEARAAAEAARAAAEAARAAAAAERASHQRAEAIPEEAGASADAAATADTGASVDAGADESSAETPSGDEN